MMKVKKVTAGEYKTVDGNYIIVKEDGFWYAIDSKTCISVVDSENTFREIKESLAAKYYR